MKQKKSLTPIKRLTIVGVGLIGGSFSRALRDASVVDEVIGYGRDLTHLSRAIELDLIDSGSTSLGDAVSDAEIVMLATPVGAMPALFEELKKYVSPDCIITDAGSVKLKIVEAARVSFNHSNISFIPGHPIAGRERSGVEAVAGDLFVGHNVILTPTLDTNVLALNRISEIWRATGASVMHMSPEQHDRILALTSHLPHMLAYALVELLAEQNESKDTSLQLAAGGFYDMSRVASSDSSMWRDICLLNRDELLIRLEEYQKVMDRLASLVRSKDGSGLEELFLRARTTRDRIEECSKVSIDRGSH